MHQLRNTRAKISAQYHRTKAELTKHPVGPVGGSEWADIILYVGYYQGIRTDLAGVFSGWAVDHDEDALMSGYDEWITADDDHGFAVCAAVQRIEAKWPTSYAPYRSDQWHVDAKAPFLTWVNAWCNAPCLFRPTKASTPLKIDGSKVKSVLMINETLDAATPYSAASRCGSATRARG